MFYSGAAIGNREFGRDEWTTTWCTAASVDPVALTGFDVCGLELDGNELSAVQAEREHRQRLPDGERNGPNRDSVGGCRRAFGTTMRAI
jgi:hypothetical protein